MIITYISFYWPNNKYCILRNLILPSNCVSQIFFTAFNIFKLIYVDGFKQDHNSFANILKHKAILNTVAEGTYVIKPAFKKMF